MPFRSFATETQCAAMFAKAGWRSRVDSLGQIDMF